MWNEHRESVIGKSVSEVGKDLFIEPVWERAASALNDQADPFTVTGTKAVIYRNGVKQFGWVNLTSSLIPGQHNGSQQVITYITDVTDHVSEKALSPKVEEYLSTFFKKAPVAIVCYRGPKFYVDLANDRALEMWGKSLDEVKGKSVEEIFPAIQTNEYLKQRHAKSVEMFLRGEEHYVEEVELSFRRNGKDHTGWYNFIHEPYRDWQGNVIGIIAVAIEVTDLVLARKRVELNSQRLQLISDALPSLISYVNREEKYEFVNRSYEQWFGRSSSELVGKTVSEVLGKQAYETVKGHMEIALSGKFDSYETWINYKDGGKRFISANYIPHIVNGIVEGYFALVIDLTDRKRHEEVIEQGEERLRLIVDGIGAGTFDHNLKNDEIHWSEKLRELLGVEPSERLDREKILATIHPDDVDRVVAAFFHTSDNDEVMAIDNRIIRQDNQEVRWMHSRAKKYLEEVEGKQVVSRIVGFSIDITAQKHTEELLKEFNTELEREVRRQTAELNALNHVLSDQNHELVQAKTLLNEILDSSIEYIAVFDTDMRYLMTNERFRKLVNKSDSELQGKPLLEIHPMAAGTQQFESLQKALSGEPVHYRKAPALSHPGVYLDSYYIPLKLNGEVEGVIAMSRDVTEIVRSEQQLENFNRQLEEAQRISKVGSWEWDLSTNEVHWSKEMYRIYGYDENVPIDFNRAVERMAKDDAERSRQRTHIHIQSALENFKETGARISEINSTEFVITLPDGTEKLLRSSGKVHLTPDGKVDKIFGAIQDVTQIRAAEREIAMKNRLLEAKNKELESFTYVASHDLQEPLRKIQTFVNRIQHGKSEKESLDLYLAKIDQSAKRMSDLIQSMLSYGRLSSGESDFAEVDLNTVLVNVKNDFEIRIREKSAVIEHDPLPTLRASPYQMNQLFSNLISNSLNFCNQTPCIRITVAHVSGQDVGEGVADKRRQYWKLTFIDNGIGFEPQFKDQIFELFQRLHNRDQYSGTGIGLGIVKRIVERHEGFVQASSVPGEGAQFTVWLPA